jgi:hypothetical protein
MLLATYLGIAAALALPGLIRAIADHQVEGAAAPTVAVLSAPLIFNFFALCGMRALLAIPTDIRANWVFRIHARGDRMSPAVGGVRIALLSAVVVPIAIMAGIVGVSMWGMRTGVLHGFMTGLLGLLLCDVLLAGVRKIPFASTPYPGGSRARARWPFYIVAFSSYSHGFASLELVALNRPVWIGPAALIISATILALSLRRHRSLQAARAFTYDEVDPDEMFSGFRLSESLAAGSGAARVESSLRAYSNSTTDVGDVRNERSGASTSAARRRNAVWPRSRQ